MAADYLTCPIADLLQSGAIAINDGYRAKNSELAEHGIPFARAGNIDGGFHFDDADRVPDETLSRVGVKVSEPGDVVFTSKGTVGRFAFVRNGTPRFVYSPQLCFWRVLDPTRISPHWLYYWMNSREFFLQFKGVAGQTDMAEYVSLRDQRAMRITLPPLPEQKRIAHILGTLDDKIELNRRMNATLESISRAIFKSWFVDFDPVRQKAAGKQPVGMDAQTATLFPDSFEDSEIGEVPKGWRIGSILEQASLLSGGTPKTDEPSYWGGGIPWASAKDVSQCGEAFLTATERSITRAGIDNSATKIIPALTTVIVSRGATTGRLTMLASDMAMNQTCYGLHSRIDAPLSLYCCAQSFISRMVAAAHGSVFDTITTKTFETTPVLLVPPMNLTVFDERVAGVFARVRLNILQSRTLAALRDTLLPKLLSGEVGVPDAEEAVEEAVR